MMPPPPNAVSSPPAQEPGRPHSSQPPSPALGPEAGSPRWLQRADLFLRVMVRLYLGLILFFLPWTHLWTINRFFLYYGAVAHILENGAVRGMVSGLGLLNLWIAIAEAIQYRED
jgi:hypothetical protein